MVLSDCPELREISWRCVIIDEAHRLKNRNCKLLDSLKMLDLVRHLFHLLALLLLCFTVCGYARCSYLTKQVKFCKIASATGIITA